MKEGHASDSVEEKNTEVALTSSKNGSDKSSLSDGEDIMFMTWEEEVMSIWTRKQLKLLSLNKVWKVLSQTLIQRLK